MDPRKEEITVRDLLMMKGGIDRDAVLEPILSGTGEWMKTIIRLQFWRWIDVHDVQGHGALRLSVPWAMGVSILC
jgi:hypothetical protein